MAEWWKEYLVRSAFHLSAEQYDNEPVERVEWMLRMINLDSELQEEAAKEAAAKAKANNGWK